MSPPAGAPAFNQIWVDPAAGNDGSSGASRAVAVRTLSEAWRRVPINVNLTTGFQINLTSGTYPESAVPIYWESRHGTQSAPVILKAIDGVGTARLPNMNVYDCRHLYILGLDISSGGGDVLHLDSCSNVLLRDTTIRGLGEIASYAVPQETLKVNQSQYIYVEHCDISGAWDNAVDFVSVQYGHVVGSRIHRSGDWAMYAKGGSASLTVAGNEFYDAGTGGFTAGQGTGFEFMVSPWLQYEAYDITFIDNVVHDTQGAGFGVNGGSNILMARNTLYRVGSRSHVIEVGFGSRACDGNQAACRAYLAQGGWGTAVVGGDEPIPNRDVFIYDNVVYNPDGYVSQWQQFAVAMPRTPSVGSNIPTPARADTNLQIRGNWIWNGPADHPLGIEQTTLAADVLAGNSINTVRPVLADPARGDYSLAPGVVSPVASVGLPSVLPPAPAPSPRLTATFRVVAATTARPVTTLTVTFNRAVRGVTLDDFVLLRGRTVASLAGARITTTDQITYTITTIRSTHLAGNYTLRLKAAGTGIFDAANEALAAPVTVSWRMTRTVRPVLLFVPLVRR
ncbi:MAG: right-handed parallel beta-helix repeat-containing protein [Planctomycetia bacterium]|nr:right-handed parallel beta-helix repeat-containing protein [Planctomycetia bacterium]